MATEKYTFKHFQAQYPDDDACLRSIFQIRRDKILPILRRAIEANED